uniref:Uncharacterized protein n=1 Tax=Peronospora matthiolae TaxID=2874970 RepID=A0AAV1U1J4_9STRA
MSSVRFKWCQVVSSVISSGVEWFQVVSMGVEWYQVVSMGVEWYQVMLTCNK